MTINSRLLQSFIGSGGLATLEEIIREETPYESIAVKPDTTSVFLSYKIGHRDGIAEGMRRLSDLIAQYANESSDE